MTGDVLQYSMQCCIFIDEMFYTRPSFNQLITKPGE